MNKIEVKNDYLNSNKRSTQIQKSQFNIGTVNGSFNRAATEKQVKHQDSKVDDQIDVMFTDCMNEQSSLSDCRRDYFIEKSYMNSHLINRKQKMLDWLESAWEIICSALPNAKLKTPFKFNKKSSYTNIYFIIISIIFLLALQGTIIYYYFKIGQIQNIYIQEKNFEMNDQIKDSYYLDRYFQLRQQNLPYIKVFYNGKEDLCEKYQESITEKPVAINKFYLLQTSFQQQFVNKSYSEPLQCNKSSSNDQEYLFAPSEKFSSTYFSLIDKKYKDGKEDFEDYKDNIEFLETFPSLDPQNIKISQLLIQTDFSRFCNESEEIELHALLVANQTFVNYNYRQTFFLKNDPILLKYESLLDPSNPQQNGENICKCTDKASKRQIFFQKNLVKEPSPLLSFSNKETLQYFYIPDTQNQYGKNSLDIFKRNNSYEYECSNLILFHTKRQMLNASKNFFQNDTNLSPLTINFADTTNIPMSQTEVQFYGLSQYISQIGGIWKAFGITAIVIIPLLNYFFYRDLKRHFMEKEGKDLKSEQDWKMMSLKLDKIFSYEEIYYQANRSCEIQKYIDELRQLNQKSVINLRVLEDENLILKEKYQISENANKILEEKLLSMHQEIQQIKEKLKIQE